MRSDEGTTLRVLDIESLGDVVVVTLRRPEVRNAINATLAAALVDAVEASQQAGALVITGAGSAFCAGLDLRELGVAELSALPRVTDALHSSVVPAIAAVNGPAVTGGLEIALACDFMVGSERASFADTHLDVGVYPGPALVDLPRRVGMAWAREMSLSGNFVDAGTALRIGLLNHVFAHDELLDRAVDLARTLAARDRSMVRSMRADWDEVASLPLAEAHRRHQERAVREGFRQVRADDIAARRRALIEHAHRQRHGDGSGAAEGTRSGGSAPAHVTSPEA